MKFLSGIYDTEKDYFEHYFYYILSQGDNNVQMSLDENQDNIILEIGLE